MDGDLLVSPDAERPDGVAGLGEDGGLAGQLLEHLGSSGQSVTALADANVQAKLADLQIPHGILELGLSNHAVGAVIKKYLLVPH